MLIYRERVIPHEKSSSVMIIFFLMKNSLDTVPLSSSGNIREYRLIIFCPSMFGERVRYFSWDSKSHSTENSIDNAYYILFLQLHHRSTIVYWKKSSKHHLLLKNHSFQGNKVVVPASTKGPICVLNYQHGFTSTVQTWSELYLPSFLAVILSLFFAVTRT